MKSIQFQQFVISYAFVSTLVHLQNDPGASQEVGREEPPKMTYIVSSGTLNLN